MVHGYLTRSKKYVVIDPQSDNTQYCSESELKECNSDEANHYLALAAQSQDPALSKGCLVTIGNSNQVFRVVQRKNHGSYKFEPILGGKQFCSGRRQDIKPLYAAGVARPSPSPARDPSFPAKENAQSGQPSRMI